MKIWQVLIHFTFLLVPHSQNSENKSTEGGSKEAPPVVPDCKKGWRDFDTEQNTCKTKNKQIKTLFFNHDLVFSDFIVSTL